MAERKLLNNIDTFRPNAKKVLKEAVLKIKGGSGSLHKRPDR